MVDEKMFNEFVKSLSTSLTAGMDAKDTERCWHIVRQAFKANQAIDDAWLEINHAHCLFCKRKQKCCECHVQALLKHMEAAQ